MTYVGGEFLLKALLHVHMLTYTVKWIIPFNVYVDVCTCVWVVRSCGHVRLPSQGMLVLLSATLDRHYP